MKVVSVVGARPQFIKAAPVSKALRESGHREFMIHTGQHYDYGMSQVFFEELSIAKPDVNLAVGSGSHGWQTGQMLKGIEEVLLAEKPDLVMVYGDTNSTLAGALAASKLHIPVAHVEAGLRSYNREMPEEINRVLTDHLSSILFCPSKVAVENLRKEGFTNVANNGDLIDLVSCSSPLADSVVSYGPSPIASRHPLIVNVGDVMFDLAFEIKEKVNGSEILNKYNLKRKDFILVTIHRAENTDNEGNLRNIWEALIELAEDGKTIFFPAHRRTMNALTDHGLLVGNMPNRVILNAPIPYGEMIALESSARLVITDSGGVQKEGYFYKTPCVIPRHETEWVELVDSDWATLTGPDRKKIIEAIASKWNDNHEKEWKHFYGDGNAAKRIYEVLKAVCGEK